MKKKYIFFEKYLHISKICCTFAASKVFMSTLNDNFV